MVHLKIGRNKTDREKYFCEKIEIFNFIHFGYANHSQTGTKIWMADLKRHQCDQMAGLFFQHLAVCGKNVPKSNLNISKIGLNICQILNKLSRNGNGL